MVWPIVYNVWQMFCQVVAAVVATMLNYAIEY